MKALLAPEAKGREDQERKQEHLEQLEARKLDKIAQRTKVRACTCIVSCRGLRDHLLQENYSLAVHRISQGALMCFYDTLPG